MQDFPTGPGPETLQDKAFGYSKDALVRTHTVSRPIFTKSLRETEGARYSGNS
jgi:hypothetical protein